MADVVAVVRQRVSRDTEPEPITYSSEAAVLRAMARNERQLEQVVGGLRDLGGAVTRVWLALTLGLAAILLALGAVIGALVAQ